MPYCCKLWDVLLLWIKNCFVAVIIFCNGLTDINWSTINLISIGIISMLIGNMPDLWLCCCHILRVFGYCYNILWWSDCCQLRWAKGFQSYLDCFSTDQQDTRLVRCLAVVNCGLFYYCLNILWWFDQGKKVCQGA